MGSAEPTPFGDIRRSWVPAAFARRLGVQPLAVHVGGVGLALFRDADGTARALIDRCPHRGVRLSLGRVADGCLECPYHGWRFAGDGRCRQVPFNPEARREQLAARAIPTVERGGLIWVFTDECAGADDPQVRAGPGVPEQLERADLRRREAEFRWACHWTRLAENMLDVAHLPFVHRRTIGRGLAGQPIVQRIEPTDFGFWLHWTPTGSQPGPWLQWWRPSASVLELPNPLGEYRQHLFSVPGRPGETRLLLVSTRRYRLALDRLLAPALDRFEDRIINEDRAVIESSAPAVVPEPGVEHSVATDVATLRFRKWYYRHQRELAGRESGQ
ncbi:MAG TPA: aromatic ring-hydroxylating dioxygenase subunit alpha [Enhygromyxa sp.]|nr:aromatic ring-hydroxylating dioxygenase subunit alpha [Enhygromyxa sp.]